MASDQHVLEMMRKKMEKKRKKKRKMQKQRDNGDSTSSTVMMVGNNPREKKWLKKKEKLQENWKKKKLMERQVGTLKVKEITPIHVVDLNAEVFGAMECPGMPRPPQKEGKKRKMQQEAIPKSAKQRKQEKPFQEDCGEDVGPSKQEGRVKNPEAMSGWKDLCVPEPVLAALEDQGFTAPTSIQALALTAAIKHRLDVIGAAQTGSGKTLAFGIPILNHILSLQASTPSQANIEEEEEEEDTEGIDDAGDADGDEVEEEGSDEGEEESEDWDHEDESDEDGEEQDEWMGGDEDDNESGDDPPPEEDCLQTLPLPEPESDEGLEDAERPLVALILEPTRELAIQVRNHLQRAATHTNVKMAVVVGGMAPQKQRRLLKRCPEIVIATPGRLWELLQEGEPHLEKVKDVQQLVIDEADRMVEKGHFQELSQLLELINRSESAKRRQTFLFSATLATVHGGPNRLLKKKKKKVMDSESKLDALISKVGLREKRRVIDLTPQLGTAEKLTESRINCNLKEKDLYLYYLLKQHPGRTLVFANSKDCVRRLVSLLSLLQLSPLSLHADMHQRQRLKNLDKFTGKSRAVLLASDVAARGLDIPKVDHVIHYQVPLVENYIHRSGRTARAEQEGLSVLLVGPEDVKNYRQIITHCKKGEDVPLFPVEHQAFAGLAASVRLARQIDQQEHRFTKKKRKNDWFQKAAKDMDLELDEELLQDLGTTEEQRRHQVRVRQLRTELELLLKRRPGLCTKYPTQMGVLQKVGGSVSALEAVKGEMKKKKRAKST